MMNMYASGSSRDCCVEGLRKEEEKQKMDPLFPRLYINDKNAEKKGGIPRNNKMALYEHLTTHSSNPHHLQSNNSSTMLVPSFFNHDAYTNKKGFFPSLCNSSGSSTTTHLNLNPTLETPLQQYPKEKTNSKFKTFQPLNCYNSFLDKKLSNNDDHENMHEAKITSSSSIHCTYGEAIPTFQRQLKHSSTTNLKLRQHQTEDDTNLFHPRGRISEPVCQNPKKRSLVDYITRYVDPNIHTHQDYGVLKDGNKSLIIAGARKRNRLEGIHELNEVVTQIPPQAGKVERNDEISNFESNISPDGVLGVMGQKQFWNTRSTIVHQQRVFAVQVFELHRLIKVQRLIAGSPELILDGSFCIGNPSKNLSTINMPYENVIEQTPPSIPKAEIDYDITKPSKIWAAESEITNIPLPSFKNKTQKYENPNSESLPPASTATDAKSDNKPCSGHTQLAPFVATEANLTPFCLHQSPGNQWLVPVRSPSEGLVYKPYTGACPTAGLVGPICGSVPFAPTYAGFLSGTPLGPTYFAPYGVPLMNPFARAESNGADNQLSIREANIHVPYQSSCNMLRHKSRESDLQGSSGSSPAERTRGEPLPLFPMVPAVQVSDQLAKSHSTDLNQLAKSHCNEKQIQVIKVVPHNPKSATESAARIFRSIQEERRVYD